MILFYGSAGTNSVWRYRWFRSFNWRMTDSFLLFLETFSLEFIVYVVLKVDNLWQCFSTQLQTTLATSICQTISRLCIFGGK